MRRVRPRRLHRLENRMDPSTGYKKIMTKKSARRSGPGAIHNPHPKIEKVMHEFKTGQLKSGSGYQVTDRDQAIAIALSEAREAGANIPKPEED